MESGMRSGASGSGIVVKNRNSSGCLIVRKKGDGLGGAASGVGSSASRKHYESNKRAKLSVSLTDSGSSEELPMPPVRRLGADSIRVCNGVTAVERGMPGGSDFSRKRDRIEQFRGNGDGIIESNGLDKRERKRNKLEVVDFNEYKDIDVERMRRHFDNDEVGFGGGRFVGSVHAARSGIDREFETGSSRHILDKRKHSYYDRPSGTYPDDNVERSWFKMNRDGARVPLPLLREKFNSNEVIRVQGKNGVLRVMVNKKKLGGPLEQYHDYKPVESRQRLKTEGTAKRNAVIHPSLTLEAKPVEKPGLLIRPEKKQIVSRKSLSSKDSKGDESDSDDSDTSLNRGIRNTEACKPVKRNTEADTPLMRNTEADLPLRRNTEADLPLRKNTEAHKPVKRMISEDVQTPLHEKLPTATMKDGKIKRGSGTEKQKLRERIREMLLNAGWTIDYRPRRNRDYLDAVYINRAGTAYWSIIKAYEALQKELNNGVTEAKPKGDSSSFAPIADDVLSQLTRKTKKKMEKELKKKKKNKYDSGSDSGKEPQIRRSASNKLDMNSMDSDSNEEKLSSFIRQGSKSMKNKMFENTIASASSKSQTDHLNGGVEKSFLGCDSHIHGRKSRKQGRCTLLIRSSNQGLNSESDGFVPYMGKRTVLSWLIDSGTVELSQKVQYRRRKKVLLEGWITRDGIHCGCCSKILPVSKFELHAGSKLPQPYQNIYLESGVSLLQCQVDAWNRPENSEKICFHSVDIDGDDPNDDTCGICGDGGDLICCDGCPSTFHQSCLGIQMLPPGEWHCPNCSCKFCGLASGTSKKDDATVYVLHTCNLCEKKYHDSCTKELDVLPNNLDASGLSFCGKECKELSEHLKKYLGTKHELEAGFSWSLIHRTDEDSEAASRGITQRVECNSKLAIALTVMDECFLPFVDRRSGTNIIHNVLYNRGSNFSRLNYSGFYTAILERGDEIISAASIRFHGTKIAEMPFIGTRHIYRRQGMCRRLFSAIELALCSLKVENLVMPAIAELMHTWSEVFGFTHLEESLRQEMRSLNMLAFPGIDMLQKLLVEHGKHEGNTTTTGSEKMGNEVNVMIKTKMGSSTQHDPLGSDDASSNSAKEMNDEYSDASQRRSNQALVDRTLRSKSHSEERSSDSLLDRCVSPSSTSQYHGASEMENKLVMDPPVENVNPSSKCQSVSLNESSVSSHPLDVPSSSEVQETACSDLHLAEDLDLNCHSVMIDTINPVLDSQVADNTLLAIEVYSNDALEVLEAVPSGSLSEENTTKALKAVPSGSLSEENITKALDAVPSGSISEENTTKVLEAVPSGSLSEENTTKVLEAVPSGSLSEENTTKVLEAVPSGSISEENPTKDLEAVPLWSLSEENTTKVLEAVASGSLPEENTTKDLEAVPLGSLSEENTTKVLEAVPSRSLSEENPTKDLEAVPLGSLSEENTTKVLEVVPSTSLSEENATKVLEAVTSGSLPEENTTKDLEAVPLGSLSEENTTKVLEAVPSTSLSEENTTKVLEAVASRSLPEENTTIAGNQYADVSGSVLNHADDGLLQRSDSNGEIGREDERNLQSNTGVTSNEMYFDESGLNASGDSSETDPV